MRRVTLAILPLSLVLAAPAAAKQSSTPVRVREPAPANATVAGFELDLVKVHKKKRAKASAATSLPKGVSVFGVVAKQKRSDRVRGVLVVVNRARTVTGAATAAAARRLTINLRHAAIPKGYALKLKLTEVDNVLGANRAFRCSSWFKSNDLAGALKLGGPRLPNITTGSLIQAACSSAANKPAYPGEGEFRYALNGRAGVMTFVASPQFPNEVNGTTSFNYPVRAFGVLADKGHQFTGCALAGATCAISSTAHPNDYALFTLSAPVAAGTQVPFALALAPNPSPRLPFKFFGMDAAGKRSGPLATSGP
jgi:hypothetical protein